MLTHVLLNAARLALAALMTIAGGSALAGPDIKDCGSSQAREMAQAIDWGAAHWKEFESEVERRAGISVKNCLENRFKKNGRVVCEKDMGGMCTSRKGSNAGWASPLNKRCHMCPDFVKLVSAEPVTNNRKACWFALIAHEWAHTCERTHKSVEKIDDIAFNFWKAKHPDVTFSLGDCGMD